MHRERLPPRLTVAEFQKKFEALEPGETFQYHSGLLGVDRVYNSHLDRVAELALVLATDPGVEVRPVDDQGPREPIVGTGQAFLVQRQNCAGHEYLIVKRSSKH